MKRLDVGRWDAAHGGLHPRLFARRAPASRATIASRTAEVSTTSTDRERSRPDPGGKSAAGCDVSYARNSPRSRRQRLPREGAQLPADERLAVALLSLIRQPSHHDVASRSDGGCKQVGRKALGAIGGDRPRRRAGNAVAHATVGGSRIRQLRARRCSPSRVSGGGSPNAPRRSARSPCRSNRRSTRARRPRPPGTRPG